MLASRVNQLIAIPILAVFGGCTGTAAPDGDNGQGRPEAQPGDDAAATYSADAIVRPQSIRLGSRESLQRMIVEEAVDHGAVPPALALAVARTASNFSNRALDVTGLVGMMQLPPDSAPDADSALDPVANVRAALDHLGGLYGNYGDWEFAVSHYRGGPLPVTGDAAQQGPHAYTARFVDEVFYWERQYRRDPIIAAWIREASGLSRFVDDQRPVRQTYPSPTAWSASWYADLGEHRDHHYRDPLDCDQVARGRPGGAWRAVGTGRFR